MKIYHMKEIQFMQYINLDDSENVADVLISDIT